MRRSLVSLIVAIAACWCQAQRTSVAARFPPPPGSTRIAVAAGTFGAYLRDLPLQPAGAPVLLHDGSMKYRQDVHAAVIGMSVGARDLQQCADALMRLRAEFLFSAGRQDAIAFAFTSGFRAEWKRWRGGERIEVKGSRCAWIKVAAPDSTHEQLMHFLEMVFTYAGTLSLSRELMDASASPIAPGDVFIRGGSPGHAMIVADVVRANDGRTFFLLAQSYMPAQDIHIVRNPSTGSSAWYAMEGDRLRTPEWTFDWSERKRWR